MKKMNVSDISKTKKTILHSYLDSQPAISKFWSEVQVQKPPLKKKRKGTLLVTFPKQKEPCASTYDLQF
jgi:hypothetical protein